MSTEARYVVFSIRETEVLLRKGFARLKKPCPPGRLTCMQPTVSHFAFMYDSGRRAWLTPPELFACLLWYCQEQGVPVAHQFEKRLEVVHNQLVLVSGHLARARSADAALRLRDGATACALCREGPCMLRTGTDTGAEAASAE